MRAGGRGGCGVVCFGNIMICWGLPQFVLVSICLCLPACPRAPVGHPLCWLASICSGLQRSRFAVVCNARSPQSILPHANPATQPLSISRRRPPRDPWGSHQPAAHARAQYVRRQHYKSDAVRGSPGGCRHVWEGHCEHLGRYSVHGAVIRVRTPEAGRRSGNITSTMKLICGSLSPPYWVPKAGRRRGCKTPAESRHSAPNAPYV